VREIEFEILTAKTAQSMAEAATIDDDPVPDRYLRAMVTSGEIAGGVTPYSLDIRAPVRLFSKEDAEIGGNSVIRLTYRAFYDSTLAYALKVVEKNAMATVAAAP
jgi:hypothetical protein